MRSLVLALGVAGLTGSMSSADPTAPADPPPAAVGSPPTTPAPATHDAAPATTPARPGDTSPPVEGPLLSDDTWQIRSTSVLRVDAGFVTGFPTALPTGLSSGVGAGVTSGRTFAWGVRAAWTTASESSIAWNVTQSDLRLRATGTVQRAAGRGVFGLRLALGTTVVHETRVRNQGMRAGLTGSELETSTYDALPAGDLEAVIALHVAGPWLLAMSGGPSLAIVDGAAHGSWTATLGVGWQP